MSSFWQVIGHESVKRVLERQLALAVFPHAYLFVGPEGIGKQTLAREFAARILEAAGAGAHPDFNFVDAGADDFDISSTRALMDRLALTPLSASYNVAVINQAHRLTPQSGNALLKTLEEPASRTIIILVADKASVLPTIQSRCQIFNFSPLTAEEMERFAASLSQPPNEMVLALSAGSPGRLRFLAEHSEYAGELSGLVARLNELMESPLAQRFAAIPELADVNADLLHEGLRGWLLKLRGNLRRQPEQFSLIFAIGESMRGLDQSLNRKLVLQRLFTAV